MVFLNKKFAIVFLLCVLFLVVGNTLIIYTHEQTHQAIFLNHGVDSRIEVGLLGARTVPQNTVVPEYRMQVANLHSMNEMFGYQLLIAFNTFSLFTFTTLLLFSGVVDN